MIGRRPDEGQVFPDRHMRVPRVSHHRDDGQSVCNSRDLVVLSERVNRQRRDRDTPRRAGRTTHRAYTVWYWTATAARACSTIRLDWLTFRPSDRRGPGN